MSDPGRWVILIIFTACVIALWFGVSRLMRHLSRALWPSPSAVRCGMAQRPLREGAVVTIVGTAGAAFTPAHWVLIPILLTGVADLAVIVRFQREATRYPDKPEPK